MTEHDQDRPATPVADEAYTLVQVGLVLRLLMLFVSLLGLTREDLGWETLGGIVFLALTSAAGLLLPSALVFLSRHPLLVVGDSLVMTMLLVMLGVDNPLVLATISSAVVIGVSLAVGPALLCCLIMVNGYMLASFTAPEVERTFMGVVGVPTVFVAIAVLGQAFRVVEQRKRRSENAYAALVASTSAVHERARLARELHDSTAKTLQGLALGSHSLSGWIGRDPTFAKEEARRMAGAAEDAVKDLRSLLSTLRYDQPDVDFRETLCLLAADVHRAHGVRVDCDVSALEVSDTGARYELLAAGREALLNAAVHSGSDVVRLTGRRDGDDVVLEVQDHGCGFEERVLADRELLGHFGVRGYTERMQRLGGSVELDSRLGRGTTVRLRAPALALDSPPASRR